MRIFIDCIMGRPALQEKPVQIQTFHPSLFVTHDLVVTLDKGWVSAEVSHCARIKVICLWWHTQLCNYLAVEMLCCKLSQKILNHNWTRVKTAHFIDYQVMYDTMVLFFKNVRRFINLHTVTMIINVTYNLRDNAVCLDFIPTFVHICILDGISILTVFNKISIQNKKH